MGAAHYTMTRFRGRLAPTEAEELSRLIFWLHQARLVPGAATAFHLVIDR